MLCVLPYTSVTVVAEVCKTSIPGSNPGGAFRASNPWDSRGFSIGGHLEKVATKPRHNYELTTTITTVAKLCYTSRYRIAWNVGKRGNL